MVKKFAGFVGVLASLAAAAPAQAQWTTFTPDNNGAEFWDNRSVDGESCNIGFVLTGVAGSTGNACSYQRPSGWLPYSGPSMTSFWASPTFTITGGSLTVNVGKGLGGDVAGEDRDWGFWTTVGSTKQFTSVNTVSMFPATYNFAPGQVWGFWVNTGSVRTSDVDGQFALFRGADDQYVVGIEDVQVPGGDRDYQDMIASVRINGVVPEPSSALLVVSGMAALAGVARRRKQV